MWLILARRTSGRGCLKFYRGSATSKLMFPKRQVDFCLNVGIHHSTLSLWLQGKIKGHYVGVEATIEEWL